MNTLDIDASVDTVRIELYEAIQRWGDFKSYHEGYAVLLEEVDELWTEIKKRSVDDSSIKFEATQVAAMAIKLMMVADKRLKP